MYNLIDDFIEEVESYGFETLYHEPKGGGGTIAFDPLSQNGEPLYAFEYLIEEAADAVFGDHEKFITRFTSPGMTMTIVVHYTDYYL